MMRPLISAPLAAASLFLAACTAQPQFQREGSYELPDTLYDPARAIEQGWGVIVLSDNGHLTDYRIDSYQDRLSIRAEGRRSASGLVLPVDFDAQRCPYLEWDWRVEVLQQGASLFESGLEDAAAAVWVMFGDPGLAPSGTMTALQPVPTLRYVWTTGRVQEETIVDSPSRPGMVRSIVAEGGLVSPLAWESEKRDLVADYQAAFGSLPPGPVRAIALVTDNDHTGEPVVAHYGPARLLCANG